MDHRALVVKIWGEPVGVREYVKERLKIPDREKTPHVTERTEEEKMFEELKAKVSKPEARQLPENRWIRPGTWVLDDQRVAFRKEGRLTAA